MDTNLDDSLNLDSAMGVDFEHSEDVTVGQSDLTGLDHTDHEESIPMEFHHIEEQPIIMDTGNEEIIVSDFMGDFPVQSIPECQFGMTDTTVMDDSNDQITFISHGEQKGEEVEYDSHIPVPASGMIIEEMNKKPQIIKVKAARMANMRPIAAKKETVVVTKTTAPRQVAIAPKPPALVDQGVFHKFKTHKVIGPGKQFAIAPKPMSNRGVSLVKKLALPATSVASQGKPITQLGHKLVMVPASAGQKIKLVAAGGTGSVTLISTGDADQAQLIQSDGNNTLTQGTKPVLAKVIMQGGEGGATPTLLTKLMPAGAGAAPVKYVTMQQKTVPISINKKVVIASPTKQGVRFATAKKQQIIAIRSPTPKLMPATTAASAAVTKKVVISASQAQNFVFKAATSVAKTGQLTKVINTSGQKTQFHQINVPGKGVQYIRLVTNPAVKPLVKPFVLTDSKGNLIQMTTDKVGDSQPPPLVVTGNINKLTAKPQQKLVTIAPLTSKMTQTAMDHAKGRRYATIKALAPSPPPSLEVELPPLVDDSHDLGLRPYAKSIKEETDSKAALQALIADTVGDDMQNDDLNEQQVDFEPPQGQSPPLDVGSAGAGTGAGGEHPLIVIPSEYYKQAELTILPDDNTSPDPHRGNEMMKIEVDPYKDFNQSPVEYPPSEPDMVSTELGLRPRKACNCTKSQCLKLYCDCFANGEFCNRCNCNNCHNNLDNEELRQKAIRGCLDRNPNAFRPKIGKAKSGGPDIIRRHNKGCNCKRSGCLKNYCECYEAKIACTAICKCVGCRNVEDSLERALRREPRERPHQPAPSSAPPSKQPCSFMTTEVIEAVCQCLLAAAAEGGSSGSSGPGGSSGPSRSSGEPVRDVVEEFARCLQEIISAAHHHQPAAPHNSSLSLLDETHA